MRLLFKVLTRKCFRWANILSIQLSFKALTDVNQKVWEEKDDEFALFLKTYVAFCVYVISLLQLAPLNGKTLGQAFLNKKSTYNNKRMKFNIHKVWNCFNPEKCDPINQLITLSMIPLSSTIVAIFLSLFFAISDLLARLNI